MIRATTILSFFGILCLCGCTTNKRVIDEPTINFAYNKAENLKEAAAVALMFSRENNRNNFSVSDIKDKKLRRKISPFGSTVSVTYENNSGMDSIVSFERFTIRYGILEIIYDFAARERSFDEDTTKSHDYMFWKVRDRVYYSRRPIPLM